MSIPLHAHGSDVPRLPGTIVGRITCCPVESAMRPDHVLIVKELVPDLDLDGYAGVITPQLPGEATLETCAGREVRLIHGVSSIHHLAEGDVVALNPGGYVRTLYRISSPHNAIFTTDRCNSFCLMCSQPPRPIDDRDRITEHLRLIELIDPRTRELGITGGEPTLLRNDLLRIVEHCKELLPDTALHILSNGRFFYYGSYAKKLADTGHPDLMIGVPLYSDLDSEHDFVVQAAGAFDQTMIGLQNLGRYGVPVEIRVVIHRHTHERLPKLAEFIYRNLPFAAHIALMGLETTGFAIPNLQDLWIDPWDYRRELEEAVLLLAGRGLNVSVYNHQLCVVPREIWSYCRKSISDWKNDYLPVCGSCCEREICGGFFTSSLQRKHSSHIASIASS